VEAMVQPAVRMAKMLPKKMPPMGENEALETKKEQTQKRKDNAVSHIARRYPLPLPLCCLPLC